MSDIRQQKAAAGFASGFLTVTALFSVLAALAVGLGPTQEGSARAQAATCAGSLAGCASD